MIDANPWARGSYALVYALAELPSYLLRQRWFPAKDAGVPALSIEHIVPLDVAGHRVAVIVWQARCPDRDSFRLCMPLALVNDAGSIAQSAIIGWVTNSSDLLVDATAVDPVVRALVASMTVPAAYQADKTVDPVSNPPRDQLSFNHTDAIKRAALVPASDDGWAIERAQVEQSNTSIRVGHGAIFKLIRKLERGTHPELEMGRYLTEQAHFAATPALLGWIDSGDTTLAIMQAFVPNDGDGWTWLLERLKSDPATAALSWLHRLGERTGELHVALAVESADPAFAPEDIIPADWQAWKKSVLTMSQRVSLGLDAAAAALDEATRAAARDYSARVADLDVILDQLLPGDGTLKKTRHHGDYHLGQVLVRGDDVVIVDFEGEPMRPLAERRAKHCALRDVAGMLRSLGYAAAVAGMPDDAWLDAATQNYLDGYFQRAQSSAGCPRDRDAALRLVLFFTIEKAFYEVSYELANRPEWVGIPLKAVNRLLAAAAAKRGDLAP